jgi:hypothetical protein
MSFLSKQPMAMTLQSRSIRNWVGVNTCCTLTSRSMDRRCRESPKTYTAAKNLCRAGTTERRRFSLPRLA